MVAFEVTASQHEEALSVSPSSRTIDRLEVTFDNPTLVADAGLVVPVTLMWDGVPRGSRQQGPTPRERPVTAAVTGGRGTVPTPRSGA
jgi:hypothetical protein